MPKFVRQGDNTLIGNNTFTGTNTFSGSLVASGGIVGDVVGNLTGNVTGNITGKAVTVTVADTTDTTSSVALFESATGDLAPKTDAGLTYNAGTGKLTATLLSAGMIDYPKYDGVVTDYDAQSATLTTAGISGGTVSQNSQTGASTLTTPTGAQLTAAYGDVTGTTLDVVFNNRGNQTSTVTGGDGSCVVVGTAAVPSTKNAFLRFVNVSTGAWKCYVIVTS